MAREPWRGKRDDSPTNRDLQQRLTEVALERLERERWKRVLPGIDSCPRCNSAGAVAAEVEEGLDILNCPMTV